MSYTFILKSYRQELQIAKYIHYINDINNTSNDV